MKNLIIAFAVLALLTSVAWAGRDMTAQRSDQMMRPTRNVTYFLDTMEAGEGSWTHVDNTATGPQPIRWHVTTYLAHPSGTYSYFCGVEPPSGLPGDLNADGGYGNDWDQFLNLPSISMAGAGYPLLSFSHRFDSEQGFDYTVLQAQQTGAYVDVMAPDKVLTGVSGGGAVPVWLDMVGVGWNMGPYDNPLVARFLFHSDGGWSDQDGDYDSNCGGIHIDNLELWDYYGYVGTMFTDDVEDGVGHCTFSVPIPGSPVGDFWHLIDSPCRALSGTRAWWCGDDADTLGTTKSLAGLDNSLFTPVIDISGAITCTLYHNFLPHMPANSGPVIGDWGWQEFWIVDGVSYQTHYSWGDIICDYANPGVCDIWYWFGWEDATSLLPASTLVWEIKALGDPVEGIQGCGGTSIFMDDFWVFGLDVTAVEESSWGNIKAMYR